ncbi:MAG: hypothetical protein IKK17_00165 [Oscillospiraceae bacterium]|nr:hypothetical protein [Oscillospiraceae bacterium]
MKKRLLSLILCIYLLVSPVLDLSAFGTEPEAPAAEAEVTAPVETDTLEWMSYKAFLGEEVLRAWDYPSMFVGSEAVFNVDGYDNFRLAPDPEHIRNLAEAALAQEAAEIAAANAAVMGEGAVEEAGEEAASEEAAPPMLPEETDGASSGSSESEEAPEGEIITEPAVMEDALTEPVIDEQPAAAEDEAAEGEDPEEGTEGEDDGYIYIDREDLLDENGSSIRVVITDCLFIDLPDESELLTCGVWYRVAAAEGYTLPEVLANNPYVQNLAFCDDRPSLLIDVPVMGMFVGETAELRSTFNMTDSALNYAAANAPAFFPITYIGDQFGNKWYDLGDISAWSFEGVELGGITAPQDYHYVAESAVVPVPAVVILAYEKLLDAENKADFESIQATIPQGVLDLFPTQFKETVEAHHQELIAKETVTLNESVTYNGIALPVSVKGKIPADAMLSVTPVSSDQVAAEGFSVSATDIVTALDIKIFNADGTEWQPADGELVELTIGMSQLGVADGSVFKLHHKHNGVINTKDIFVVMNGCLTIYTDGFSIYVVDDTADTTGTEINNGGSDTIHISDKNNPKTVYYFNAELNQGTVVRGTWNVEDPTGAVHYTVYANIASNAIGSNALVVPWIEITPLKETPNNQPIILTYNYVVETRNGWNTTTNLRTETYYIHVDPPMPTDGKPQVYIRDDVNNTGKIIVDIVDATGNRLEHGLDGAAVEWSRSDNWRISYRAYDAADGYQSVNIARDHGGLTEARRTNGIYNPITYTAKVTLANGDIQTATYTVYYQSEILNADFEYPNSIDSNYGFFPNGWTGLYWETSAPGNSTTTVAQDIEYGDVSDGNRSNFGVTRAADYDNGGKQFAELNAENFGALYQDIITAPGEEIAWDFSHAARTAYSWQGNNSIINALYIVIGPTEEAQKLITQAQLEALGSEAKRVARALTDGGTKFFAGTEPVEVTYSGAQYSVWYHDAGTSTLSNGNNSNSNIHYDEAHNYGWSKIEGTYVAPDDQYRTRLFFISDSSGATLQNAGNLIDKARAGQYKKYLIEYYEQTYDGTIVKTVREGYYDEKGEALIYSNKKLENYNHFIKEENDYLYMVKINGQNYPYDIRYDGDASLYIENYGPVTNTVDYDEARKNEAGYQYPYSNYDIVMQIFLRDTVIAVQKEVIFPKDPVTKQDLLTEEQKLEIFAGLTANGGTGYQANFELKPVDQESMAQNTATAVIPGRDPNGTYKGFVAMGANPDLNRPFVLEETSTSQLPGLELESVIIGIQRYSMGNPLTDDKDVHPEDYTETEIAAGKDLISCQFQLENNIKIADIKVTNTYKEKEVVVRYEAVGNGKVTLKDTTNFQDAPEETIKYYSGKATGGAIHAGNNASFVGWFHDKECKLPVQSKDGVVDSDGTFRPNANVIVPDASGKKTFYAKFVTHSVVITKTGGEPGKTYVYALEGPNGLEMEVFVTCDEKGEGRTEIFEAPAGEYSATEQGKWSWRDDAPAEPVKATHIVGDKPLYQITLPFDGNMDRIYWLDGFSNPTKNVFTKLPDKGGNA